MARVKMSKDGSVVIPKALRDAHGLTTGVEFDVIDGGQKIVLEMVEEAEAEERRKASAEKFLAFLQTLPKYQGPHFSDEEMHTAINQAAIEDWERLERQWNDDKDD